MTPNAQSPPRPQPLRGLFAALLTVATALPALLTTGCGSGGGSSAPLQLPDVDPELVYCRARRDSPHRGTDIRTMTRRGLADQRAVPDRAGLESHVRVHPDGVQVVFSRERRSDDPSSSEIYTATLDGSGGEVRLTADGTADTTPCWADDGERVLFTSARDGTPKLYTMTAIGSEVTALFDDGSEQHQPDAAGSLIVYSRLEPLTSSARRELWLLDTGSGVSIPITDGGTGTSSEGPAGDFQPAFSPDGRSILFSRSFADTRRQLMLLDLDARTLTAVTDGSTDDRQPRWSPTADALFFTRDDPAVGLEGARIYEAAPDGTGAALLLTDKRWDATGLDVLPTITARATRDAPVAADPDDFNAVVAFGSGTFGSLEVLDEPDGLGLSVFTGIFNRRDVAGLRIDVPLPTEDPLLIERIDLSVRVALSRVEGDTVIRLTLDNPVENRNDTILERTPTGTGLETFTISTQNLTYVNRSNALRFTVIGDLPEGDRAELLVDHLDVQVTLRQ